VTTETIYTEKPGMATSGQREGSNPRPQVGDALAVPIGAMMRRAGAATGH
jgi:hypothetical protein